MNQNETKEALLDYLARGDDYRVVALRGAWGCGKTHLWKAISEEPQVRGRLTPVYCSLFGLGSIDEVKSELLSQVVKNASESADGAKKYFSGLAERFGEFVDVFKEGAGAASNLVAGVVSIAGTAMLERSLSGRLIVLDDFERRGHSMELVSMLGLIDYLKAKDCRVLFIFNDEMLKGENDQNILAEFREKVIDADILLETSPEEAFEIAAEKRSVPYLDAVKEQIVALGLTNIRVIARVLIVLDRVFSNHRNLAPIILTSTLKPAITLSAVYFRASKDWPQFDDLVSVTRRFSHILGGGDSPDVRVVRDFATRNLGDADEQFVSLVGRLLTTGAPLRPEFDEYWARRNASREVSEIRARFMTWLSRVWWDPGSADESLVQEAVVLIPEVQDSLHVDEVDGAYAALMKIGYPSARAFLDTAVERIRANRSSREIDRASFGTVATQELKDVIKEIQATIEPPPTLREAIVRSRHTLSSRDQNAMARATTADFVREFGEADMAYLQAILHQLESPGQYGFLPNLDAAMKEVVATSENPRLVEIVRWFASSRPRLRNILTPPHVAANSDDAQELER